MYGELMKHVGKEGEYRWEIILILMDLQKCPKGQDLNPHGKKRTEGIKHEKYLLKIVNQGQKMSWRYTYSQGKWGFHSPPLGHYQFDGSQSHSRIETQPIGSKELEEALALEGKVQLSAIVVDP